MARSKISFSLKIFNLARNLEFFDLWALWERYGCILRSAANKLGEISLKDGSSRSLHRIGNPLPKTIVSSRGSAERIWVDFFYFGLANFRKIVLKFLSEFLWRIFPLIFQSCLSRVSNSRPKLSAFLSNFRFFNPLGPFLLRQSSASGGDHHCGKHSGGRQSPNCKVSSKIPPSPDAERRDGVKAKPPHFRLIAANGRPMHSQWQDFATSLLSQ